MGLLGHMACLVLVPVMVIPVIESMCENMNLDIQPIVAAEYIGVKLQNMAHRKVVALATSTPTECLSQHG